MEVVDRVLSSRERQALLLSVGTHRGRRPLSPVEVAGLLGKVIAAGGSLKDCARAGSLKGTAMVARFLRLLELPETMRHLVDWRGGDSDAVAFSSGTELARLDDVVEQEEVVRGVLIYRLSGSEVRQVVQLRKRSKRPVEECLKEVVEMRPPVEKRYVYIGAVTNSVLKRSLGVMTQGERDELLASAIKNVLGEDLAVARLGPGRFTLVGGAEFGEAMNQRRDSLEQDVNEALQGARS